MDYLSQPFPAQHYEVEIDIRACSYVVEHIQEIAMGGLYDENRPSGQRVVNCKSEPELLLNFFKGFIRIPGTNRARRVDTYNQSAMNPRRMTTKSTSLQGIPRVMRHTVCRDNMKDLDIANCHPEILAQWCKKNGIVSSELAAFNKEKKERFQEVQTVMKWTKQQMKDYMLKLLNGGGCGPTTREIQETLANHVPWYCPLIAELDAIRKNVMRLHPELEKKAKRSKETNYNVEGTVLSYLLTNLENQFLQVMVQTCAKKGYKISSLIFDGLMLYKDTVPDVAECCAVLQEALAQTGYTFSIVEKDMDEGVTIPVEYLMKEDRIEKEKEEKQNEKEALLRQKSLVREVKYSKKEDKKQKAKQEEEAYLAWKERFEQDHFKVVSMNMIGRQHAGGIVFKTQQELSEALSHETDYIKEWYSDKDVRVYDRCDILTRNQVVPHDVHNMWEDPIAITYPTDGDASLLYQHIKEVIANDDDAVYQYLLDWMAQMLQFPECKTTMIVGVSSEGAGKDTWVDMFRGLLGTKFVMESHSAKALFGDFNFSVLHKKLLVAEELSAKELSQYDGAMKVMITNNRLQVQQKYKDGLEVESQHRLLAFTNNENSPIQTSDKDRRKVIIRCSDRRIGDTDYFIALRAKIEDNSVIGALYNDLMKRDVVEFNRTRGKRFPETAFQKLIKSGYINPVRAWLQFIIQEEKYKDMDEYKENENEWVWSSANCVSSFSQFCELMKFNTKFEVSAPQLGIKLNNLNLDGVRVKPTNKGRRYYFNVPLLQTYFETKNEDENLI